MSARHCPNCGTESPACVPCRVCAPAPAIYPHSWSVELRRNDSGRAFFYVSRFVARNLVEYLTDLHGAPRCFRLQRDAALAMNEAQA